MFAGIPDPAEALKLVREAISHFLHMHDLTCEGVDCNVTGIDPLRRALAALSPK